MNRIFFCFVFVVLLFADSIWAADWKAGAAKVKITPEENMWLAGYAARNRASEGILHDLWAKALVLEDAEGNRAVLITMDLVGVPKMFSENIRKQLEDKLGFDKAQIILNASHTHSGPVLHSSGLREMYVHVNEQEAEKIVRYSRLLEQQVIDAAVEASKSLEPVTLEAANGVARFQVNRRNNAEGKLTPLTELKGPNDYAVPVLKVTNAAGQIKVIAFGYACHPTTLDSYLWCGDYPGFAQAELEKNYPGTTTMFFQGAGADQNPMPRRTIPLAKQYGVTLAAAVDRVLQEKMNPLPPTLKTAYKEAMVPLETFSADYLKEIAESTKQAEYYKRCAKHVLNRYKDGEPPFRAYPFPVQVWNIGGLPLFTLGGELTVGYSIRLKEKYGEHIFVMGYTNDVMSYIPTVTILKEGGYEGASSQMIYGMPGMWTEDIETVIHKALDEIAKQTGVPLSGAP
ncbi:MAG: neutral/alkaline non-lysosomal ceramidase N-terminal domain-containing protein [Planctomycetaceae bacterium]|nr:neutral/alkaline non-lysosomal ceramidase N-terminal domain-containing protein [Planctomycetaceae bacterium]